MNLDEPRSDENLTRIDQCRDSFNLKIGLFSGKNIFLLKNLLILPLSLFLKIKIKIRKTFFKLLLFHNRIRCAITKKI
jgi:hypothetical protein